jgi:hypothetical protein
MKTGCASFKTIHADLESDPRACTEGGKEMVSLRNLRGKQLALFFILQLIVLCLIASFQFVNLESTITLLIFNFLFASLTFQLEGTIFRKLGMLVIGNFVGLFWNLVFHYFAIAGSQYLGGPFDALYTILYPILNLMWVVPFWSLSLSVLPKTQTANAEVKLQ